MIVGQTLRKSFREFQQSWDRMADSVFGRAASPSDGGETARGEFISDFISERGLNFPQSERRTPR